MKGLQSLQLHSTPPETFILFLKLERVSKANLDEKILFGKTIHHFDPEIRKMLVRGMFWNKGSSFHSGL